MYLQQSSMSTSTRPGHGHCARHTCSQHAPTARHPHVPLANALPRHVCLPRVFRHGHTRRPCRALHMGGHRARRQPDPRLWQTKRANQSAWTVEPRTPAPGLRWPPTKVEGKLVPTRVATGRSTQRSRLQTGRAWLTQLWLLHFNLLARQIDVMLSCPTGGDAEAFAIHWPRHLSRSLLGKSCFVLSMADESKSGGGNGTGKTHDGDETKASGPLRVTETPNSMTMEVDVVGPHSAVRCLHQADAQMFAGWKSYPGATPQHCSFDSVGRPVGCVRP